MHFNISSVDLIIREVANEIVLPKFRSLQACDIKTKISGGLVTIADIEAEKLLRRRLLELLPGSLFVGEESCAIDPSILSQLYDDSPVWIVDPIDGTSNYSEGKKQFAMIIALMKKGKTVAGWIYDPIHNKTCISEVGAGAWCEGTRLKINAPISIESWRASFTKKSATKLHLNSTFAILKKNIVRYKCVGLEYFHLAQNRLQCARYGGELKPWDHAAGGLIHREAGGFGGNLKTHVPYNGQKGILKQSILMTPDKISWLKLAKILD